MEIPSPSMAILKANKDIGICMLLQECVYIFLFHKITIRDKTRWCRGMMFAWDARGPEINATDPKPLHCWLNLALFSTEPDSVTWIFQFCLVQAFVWCINWPGAKLRAVDPLSHGLWDPMVYPWCTHDVPMVYLWSTYDLDHGIGGNISVGGLIRAPGGNIHQIKACDSQIEKNHVTKAGAVDKDPNFSQQCKGFV